MTKKITAKDRRSAARMDAVFDVIQTDRYMLADEIAVELNRQERFKGFPTERKWARGDVYATVRDIRRTYPDLARSLVSYPTWGFRFSEDLAAVENERSRVWAANPAESRIKTLLSGVIEPLVSSERQRARLRKEFERIVEDIRDTL